MVLVAALLVGDLPLSRPTAAGAGATIPGTDVINGEVGAETDLFLTRLSRIGFSGAALIAHEGAILLKKGYGKADRDLNIGNRSETRFEIGSLSMIFTAAAILKLESEQRLDLHDPVNQYVGPLAGGSEQATIHHLLIHTSGLFAQGEQMDYSSRQAFLNSVRVAAIAGAPGARFQHSNDGYTLLAAIVEIVSGMPFETYLRTRLFQPAGMQSTGFAWQKVGGGVDRATGYAGDSRENQQPVPPTDNLWGHRGVSGVLTNVGDLYRWVLALQSATVLPEESLAKMFSTYVGDDGYAWHVVNDSNLGRLVRRGGGLPAFEGSIRWYRDARLVVVLAANNNRGYRIRAAKGIAEILTPHIQSVSRAPRGSP